MPIRTPSTRAGFLPVELLGRVQHVVYREQDKIQAAVDEASESKRGCCDLYGLVPSQM